MKDEKQQTVASPIEPVVSGELSGVQKFARELLTASFEGCSFDGGDIQDLALKHDLVRIEIYDPEVHVTAQGCEALDKGNDIYCFNDALEVKDNSC